MDIVTQALLGGVLAQSVSRTVDKKLATGVGMLSGLVADADILISSVDDPLLNIEYHRHFSHALVFIPFGALLSFAVLWPFLRNRLSAKRLYLYSLMGYSMSGLLDACTSYGTHLLWPFTDERVAWGIISIVDPIFSLILLASLVIAMKYRISRSSIVGLSLAFAYLAVGAVQHHRVQSFAEDLLVQNNSVSEKHIVKPTLGNLLLWRQVYIHDDMIYVNAIRAGLFSDLKLIKGESIELFSLQKHINSIQSGSILHSDIVRFITFSDGYVGYDPAHPNVLGDIRYSMLPTSSKPLWGIVIKPELQQQHAQYKFFRETSKESRQLFVDMLLDY